MSFKGKKITSIILTTIMILAALPVIAFADDTTEKLTDWTINLFNDENGLPTAEANAVLCTSDGYMWIGSYGGLLRYNGNSFVNFSNEEDGIPVYSIRSLYEASNGLLYIGTSEGVYTWNRSEFKHIDVDTGFERPSVHSFAEDSHGNVYAGTSDGLLKIGADGVALSADPDNHLSGTIYSLVCGKDDVIWGTDLAGALFAIKDGEVLYYGVNEDSTVSYYSVAVISSEDDLVLAVGTSVNRVSIITVSGSIDKDNMSVKNIQTGNVHTINKMYLQNNTLWIAGSSGAGRINLEDDAFITDAELLECTALTDITLDYESNVWMSSSNYGVFEVAQGSVYHPVEAQKLQKESVTSVSCSKNVCYVGTGNGLFVLNSNFEIIESKLSTELNGAYIRCVMADNEGNIWISMYNSEYGLICYNPEADQVEYYGAEEGLATNQVRSTIELFDGRIAVATAYGLYIINKESKTVEEFYSEAQGLYGVMILSLTQSSDGTLYIATDNKGLFALEDGKIREVDGTLGSILRTRWDNDLKGMWLSNSSGLYFMDSEENLKKITVFDEGVGSIFDILVKDNDLFILKSSGIYRMDKIDLVNDIDTAVRVYDSTESFSGNCVSNSWSCINKDRLYVCSTKGLYLINTDSSSASRVIPKVVIDKVVYTDDFGEHTIVAGEDTISLPQFCERLTIYFSCLHYNKQQYEMKYCLDGFGEDIKTVKSTEEGVATYTNMNGGSYIFVLYSSDKNGKTNTPLQVEINKEYKLTEKAWFQVLLGLSLATIVALIVIAIFKARIKAIRKEEERYKNITTQALETIAHTIDAKDKYTNGHSMRVAEYSREIGKRLGLTDTELENLYYIALLHDIGKIGIPDGILNKPGKLTDEEFSVMRSHTVIGAEILKDFKLINGIAQGAIGHHERYDGQGYPNKLKGKDNTYFARIISVADAYDAMASDRPYRKHLSREYILDQLEKGKGTQFDPEIDDAMIEYLKSLPNEEMTVDET